MGNGIPRAGEEGLWEPRGQGAAMLPLSTGPVQETSCPFCSIGLETLMELSPGTRGEHPCSAPGISHPCHTEEVVVPVVEIVPGPTCLWCPALSWASEPAPTDFVLLCAHPHPEPCSVVLASGAARPQLPRPAVAPFLPPSPVHHAVPAASPCHGPHRAETPGAQPHHLSRDAQSGWTCSLAPN